MTAQLWQKQMTKVLLQQLAQVLQYCAMFGVAFERVFKTLDYVLYEYMKFVSIGSCWIFIYSVMFSSVQLLFLTEVKFELFVTYDSITVYC